MLLKPHGFFLRNPGAALLSSMPSAVLLANQATNQVYYRSRSTVCLWREAASKPGLVLSDEDYGTP